MTSYATRLMDPAAASVIEVRPSTDDDVPAMLAIYQHHVTHGVGDLGAYEPSRFDEEDLKRRRKNMRKHRLSWLASWGTRPTPRGRNGGLHPQPRLNSRHRGRSPSSHASNTTSLILKYYDAVPSARSRRPPIRSNYASDKHRFSELAVRSTAVSLATFEATTLSLVRSRRRRTSCSGPGRLLLLQQTERDATPRVNRHCQ